MSATLPYVLLRPLASYNNPPASAPASTQLSTSGTLKIYVTTFLTVLYAVTIYTSIQTFLPSYLISKFDVRTLEPAYAASLPVLVTAAIPLGNAAKDFLYVPSTYLAKAGGDAVEFDPINSSLAEIAVITRLILLLPRPVQVPKERVFCQYLVTTTHHGVSL